MGRALLLLLILLYHIFPGFAPDKCIWQTLYKKRGLCLCNRPTNSSLHNNFGEESCLLYYMYSVTKSLLTLKISIIK